MGASLSAHFGARKPSAIRQAQILFAERADRAQLRVINLAVGNVSLPMHPAMRRRLAGIAGAASPFAAGVVGYTGTVGTDEARQALLRVLEASGCATDGLHTLVTDGGSQAMELMLLGVAGPGSRRPVLFFDPVYTNYIDMAKRAVIPTIAVPRRLGDDGAFSMPALAEVAAVIERERPCAMVVIPADNPTGQLLRQDDLRALAELCVRYDLWLVSDEAYRELQYAGGASPSIWRLDEREVPGIGGRRISIETASKMWNACGLRVGGLVTDHHDFQRKAVAEYTANLCANAIGQHIFGALAHESAASLQAWFAEQRTYYAGMMRRLAADLAAAVPGIIVSQPAASLYSVIDVRRIAPASFDAAAFVAYCAQRGRVTLEDGDYTLLVAPMGGFYRTDPALGRTQMRLAYVATPELMAKVPRLFAELWRTYCAGA